MNDATPLPLTLPLSTLATTGAGLCALWDPSRFTDVVELEQWEDLFCEDESIVRLITEGAFVPLNIGGDGAFQVAVRTESLTARERNVLAATSQPYQLITQGRMQLGGLEEIGSCVGGATEFAFDAGIYSVIVHLIDSGADAASVDADGKLTAEALPDFIVTITSTTPENGVVYRTDVRTFSGDEIVEHR